MPIEKFSYQTDSLFVGQQFPTKSALFVAVTGKKPPSGGSKNIASAYKNLNRYVEFKKCCELDSRCSSKRSVAITAIYNPPRPANDQRGAHGTYIDNWRSLLVEHASFSGSFRQLMCKLGVFYELFDNSSLKNTEGDTQDLTLQSLMSRPWAYDKNTPSGVAEYGWHLKKQLRDTVERAMGSLAKQGVLSYEEHQQIVYPHIVDHLKCLEAIKAEAQKPNSCLDPDLASSLILEADSGVENPPPFSQQDRRATDMQIQAIENYKLYLRQCVYGVYIGGDVLPSEEIDWISNAGKFFSLYQLRKMYLALDRELRGKLFDGIWFWKEYQYSIIDPDKAITYRCADSAEVAAQLNKKMVDYMDKLLYKHEICVQKEDLSDLIEGKFIGEIKCGTRLPLAHFKSVRDIHNEFKAQYGAGA